MSEFNIHMYIQAILAVRNPQCLIEETWEKELYQCITETMKKKGHRILAINALPDHIHLFFQMNPGFSIDEIITDIKNSSTRMIHEKKFSNHQFRWQGGYGAFSYSAYEIDHMVAYINNQKNHHELISFKDEFINLLMEHEIEYKDEDLFDWIEY